MAERFQPIPTIIIKDIQPSPEGSLVNGKLLPVPPEKLKNLYDFSDMFNEDFCMVIEDTRVCVVVNEASEFAIDALEQEIIENDIKYDPQLLSGILNAEVDLPAGFNGTIQELLSDRETTLQAIGWATEGFDAFHERISKISEQDRMKIIEEKRSTVLTHFGLFHRTIEDPRRYNGHTTLFRSIAQSKVGEYILNGKVVHNKLVTTEDELPQ